MTESPSPTLPAQESALPAPCPFCGGDTVFVALCGFGTAKVTCDGCGSEGSFSRSAADALAAWNRRATPPIQQGVVEALEKIIAATHSHIDGRDLLAELHPRNMLDIKRRVDARETWFEGDWLSGLWKAVKEGRAALASLRATSGENGNG